MPAWKLGASCIFTKGRRSDRHLLSQICVSGDPDPGLLPTVRDLQARPLEQLAPCPWLVLAELRRVHTSRNGILASAIIASVERSVAEEGVGRC